MAVAKSYENMEIRGEPYAHEDDPKKLYVRVVGPCKRCGGNGRYSYNPMDGDRCFACGGSGKEVKEVRWYTDKQREALDRAAEKRATAKTAKVEERRVKFAARNAFGFGEAGYITLFKGDRQAINEWAHETSPCRARYNEYFEWFCPSTLAYENLPESITPIKLTWDEVRDTADPENLTMKDGAIVRDYVNSLIHDASVSQYQGEVGEWIERTVTIIKNVFSENRYGGCHFHVMEDENQNVYVWSATSKSIEEGTTVKMRMKVKDHQEYQRTFQTVVYYCKEIK